ncbi:hypothetical protein ElyMa_002812100 [Elysia marginata]|uniref:Uncharacterized protein n=1 Tax=Elysia marginata TaxID=1093978 RepID=A0AAV4HQB5_9GAST|nr:hypothetical protein ElyMa_002812100 [Elysia marginata]
MCFGLKHIEHITSTTLRKHIASLSQIMNLLENEMNMLSSQMGHDIRVHKEYYRLSQDVLETAKVRKLLVMMERGALQHLKGKTLQEGNIPDHLSRNIEGDDLVEQDEIVEHLLD